MLDDLLGQPRRPPTVRAPAAAAHVRPPRRGSIKEEVYEPTDDHRTVRAEVGRLLTDRWDPSQTTCWPRTMQPRGQLDDFLRYYGFEAATR